MKDILRSCRNVRSLARANRANRANTVEKERAGDQIEERVENTRRPLRKESLSRSDGTPPSDAFTQDHTVQSEKH